MAGLINGNVSKYENGLRPTQNPNDVLLNRTWLNWVYDRVEKTNAFFKSNVLSQNDALGQRLLQAGTGYMVTIPHVSSVDLDLKPQKWNDNTDIVANPQGGTYPESEVKLTEAQSFGNSDFSDYITGIQTLSNISAQFADYWGHVDEERLIKVVNAAFKNQTIAQAKSYGIGNEKDLSPVDFAKAFSRMGDNNLTTLSTIAVNSAVYQYMKAKDVIKYIQPSNAIPGSGFATYNGYRIIVDDDIPVDKSGKTCMYIFGSGAVDYATATAPNGLSTTRDDNQQGGINQITQKRIVVCHINGTDADLDAASQKGYSEKNWGDAIDNGNVALYKPVNKWDLRNIKIVKYGFTIDKDFVVPGVNAPNADGTPAGTGPQVSVSNSSSKGSNNSSNSKSSSKK